MGGRGGRPLVGGDVKATNIEAWAQKSIATGQLATHTTVG